jgi:hypothetical protein
MPVREPRRRPPKATVLMDTLPAHKARAVETTLAEAGLKLLYRPRHSPDLSLIEPGWSKTTSALRTAEGRTRDALEAALAPALDSITPANARGWSNPGGYAIAATRCQTDRKTALISMRVNIYACRRDCSPLSHKWWTGLAYRLLRQEAQLMLIPRQRPCILRVCCYDRNSIHAVRGSDCLRCVS